MFTLGASMSVVTLMSEVPLEYRSCFAKDMNVSGRLCLFVIFIYVAPFGAIWYHYDESKSIAIPLSDNMLEEISMKDDVTIVILGEPAVADMNQDGIADVVVGTVARRLHCLSGKDGAELWSSEVGAQIRFSAPLLLKTAQDGAPLVFVGTGPPDNALYCLRGSSPRLNPRDWLSPWK
jgi:hypothetical protein